MDQPLQLLTLPAFCARYSVGRTRAYEEINAARLKAIKVGRRTMIKSADADSWLESRPAVTPRAVKATPFKLISTGRSR